MRSNCHKKGNKVGGSLWRHVPVVWLISSNLPLTIKCPKLIPKTAGMQCKTSKKGVHTQSDLKQLCFSISPAYFHTIFSCCCNQIQNMHFKKKQQKQYMMMRSSNDIGWKKKKILQVKSTWNNLNKTTFTDAQHCWPSEVVLKGVSWKK